MNAKVVFSLLNWAIFLGTGFLWAYWNAHYWDEPGTDFWKYTINIAIVTIVGIIVGVRRISANLFSEHVTESIKVIWSRIFESWRGSVFGCCLLAVPVGLILFTLGNAPVGPKQKVGKKIFAIVQNSSAPHMEDMYDGFVTGVRGLLQDTEYEPKFNPEIASPYRSDSLILKKAFENALQEKPDVLVTIGTNVSEFAVRNYLDHHPIFFIGVTSPTRSKLISPGEIKTRETNISGYSNGIKEDSLIANLTSCFPNKKFAFLYHKGTPQDMYVKELLEREQLVSRDNPMDVILVPIESFAIPDSLKSSVDIFWGWNYLNEHIDSIVKHNPRDAIIGPATDNFMRGVVATVETDYRRLGESAADRLVSLFLMGDSTLGDMSVRFPNCSCLALNLKLLKEKGVSVDKNCPACKEFGRVK